jgi:hypothetical protein
VKDMFEIIEKKYDYKFVLFLFFFIFTMSLIVIYLFSSIRQESIDFFPLLLFGLALGLIISFIAFFASKIAVMKIPFTNKHEFICEIDFLLNKIDCHKVSSNDDKLTYRYTYTGLDIFNKIDITIKKDYAYITGSYHLIKKIGK